MSLRDIFGEMILKKGTILYHISTNIFTANSDKHMLFLTFHPSDYIQTYDSYVTQILLNKDIAVLFMITGITWNLRVLSALGKLTGQTGGRHRFRKKDTNLIHYKKYLEDEEFDGWFSSINDDFETEIAIINNSDIYTVLSCEKLNADWKRPRTDRDGIYLKSMNWGSKYNISTMNFPIQLNINYNYKNMIEKTIECIDKDSTGIPFLIVLKNAEIIYRKTIPGEIIWNFE